MALLRYWVFLILNCLYWGEIFSHSPDFINQDIKNFSCADGEVFKSLEECVYECRRVHEKRINLTKPMMKKENVKIQFKVVELLEDEFSVSNGSILSNLPRTKLPPDTFSISNNTAHVCYSLDELFIQCKKWYLYPDEYDLFNKSRLLWVHPYKRMYSLGEFYIDQFENEALVCKHGEDFILSATVDVILVVGYTISALSLIITFILSLMIPELNIRNNRILMCHLIILSFAYCFLIVRYSLTDVQIVPLLCRIIALIIQFCFLGSFFWINVQAVDLFIHFINLNKTKNTQREKIKFILYSLYAWGCPLILSTITLIKLKSNTDTLQPNFNLQCWFDPGHKLTAFIYFYGPISIILLVNVVLFILTIAKLYSVGKNANNVNKKIHTRLLQLYFKLFVVMGLIWIFEILSWAFGSDNHHWYFADVMNAFQGLFIFIIYVCKPSYLSRLCSDKSSPPLKRSNWWLLRRIGQTKSMKIKRNSIIKSKQYKSDNDEEDAV